MKIFFDFDDTLFHTQRFKRDLIDVFIRAGVTQELFNQTYYHPGSLSGRVLYDPNRQIETIEKLTGQSYHTLKKEVTLFLQDVKHYVFADVIPFLRQIKRADLFMISYGHPDFLRQKIAGSTLSNFFSEIHVVDESKGPVLRSILERSIQPMEQVFLLTIGWINCRMFSPTFHQLS